MRAACQGKGGCFDFRSTIVFEISPSPLRHIKRRAIKPGPAQDSENSRGGHRIPALRINEAADDRTLACLELHDATQSRRQAAQASESPRRLLHSVLCYIPECGRANLFVRPISGTHDALFDWPHSQANSSLSACYRTWSDRERLSYYTDFIEFIVIL